MKKILPLIVLLVLFGLMNEKVHAQGFPKKHRYTSIGVSINAMNYVGELDPGPSFISPGLKFTRPNIGVEYIYRWGPRISFRGNLCYGQISGSDEKNASYSQKDIYRKIRNLDMKDNILELKGDVIIDLWENRGKYTKRPDYTPYVAVGLAYFHMNPKGQINNTGTWYTLDNYKIEGKVFSKNQLAIPVSLGFRYKLSKQWDLAFEVGWRFTLTDYLDGVSKKYVDPTTLPGGVNGVAYQLDNQTYQAYQNDPTLQAFVNSHYGGLTQLTDSKGNPLYYTSGPNSGQPVYTVPGYGAAGDKRGTTDRDWYIVTGFHLSYIIPGRVICPKFR